MPTSTLSESKVHQFNLSTLRLDRELEALEINLLLLPGEIQKRAVVAAQWHTAMDKQVCPLCNSMQGGIIPVDSPEWGRVAPPVHLGCRCMLSYITADERGVVARLEKHKPIDPVLLKHWSSKIYTDREIRAMARKRPDLPPEGKRVGFDLPTEVKSKADYEKIVGQIDMKGVEKANSEINKVYGIRDIKKRIRDVNKNWDKYYISRRRYYEWKRIMNAQYQNIGGIKKTMKLEAVREKLAQRMLAKKYKNYNAVFADWDELVKIAGKGTANEKWIWTEYMDYQHALRVNWIATDVSAAEALPRIHSMDTALRRWVKKGAHDPGGVDLVFVNREVACFLPGQNRIHIGSGRYYWSEKVTFHEYTHALQDRMFAGEMTKFSYWHRENVRITFTTAHMRNQTYYLQRNQFTEEWAIGLENLCTGRHDSPQFNFAHPRVKAKLKELMNDAFNFYK